MHQCFPLQHGAIPKEIPSGHSSQSSTHTVRRFITHSIALFAQLIADPLFYPSSQRFWLALMDEAVITSYSTCLAQKAFPSIHHFRLIHHEEVIQLT